MIRAAEGNFLCGERAYVKYSQTACILHKEEFNWHWIAEYSRRRDWEMYRIHAKGHALILRQTSFFKMVL